MLLKNWKIKKEPEIHRKCGKPVIFMNFQDFHLSVNIGFLHFRPPFKICKWAYNSCSIPLLQIAFWGGHLSSKSRKWVKSLISKIPKFKISEKTKFFQNHRVFQEILCFIKKHFLKSFLEPRFVLIIFPNP